MRAYTGSESTTQLVKTLAVIFAAIVVAWALYLARSAVLLIYISVLLATGFSPLVVLIDSRISFSPVAENRVAGPGFQPGTRLHFSRCCKRGSRAGNAPL